MAGSNDEREQVRNHLRRAPSDSDSSSSDEEDPLAHLPAYVINRVEKLEELDSSRATIMEEYLAERSALEKKFEERLKPLYAERAAIVRGSQDGAIAKVTKSSKLKGTDPDANKKDDVVGIPQFWACAMTQMETIGELIAEEDVDCLEHLQDITCVNREDGKGFTLRFLFSPNDYFTNSVIEKTYEVPNLLLSDEPLLKNVTGTSIDWKPGRSLTYRTIKKKQRGKGKHAGQLRTVSKREEKESFFHWFTPPEMPPMDTMDEDEAEKLEELFDSDYEVAQAFRNDLIPQAVVWFSGKVRLGLRHPTCVFISVPSLNQSVVNVSGARATKKMQRTLVRLCEQSHR